MRRAAIRRPRRGGPRRSGRRRQRRRQARLGRERLRARQISPRGGDLLCELRDGRVFMTGTAVTFMEGRVTLNR